MPLSTDVHEFTRACEHLLAGMAIDRLPTEDEVLVIKHYCNEVISQIDSPARNPDQVPIPLPQ